MSIKSDNCPVAETVAALIKEEGFKQYVIAKRAGYSIQMLSDMLHGRRLIKAHDVPRLARALNVTPNDLYRHEARQPDQ